jgi:tetratricopeptide (TPR) repeat protein
LSKQGEFERAIDIFEMVLKDDSFNWKENKKLHTKIIKKLSICFEKNKELEKAISILDSLQTKDLHYHMRRATLFEKIKKPVDSINSLLKLLEEDCYSIEIAKKLLKLGYPFKDLLSFYKTIEKKENQLKSLCTPLRNQDSKSTTSDNWIFSTIFKLVKININMHINLHKSECF